MASKRYEVFGYRSANASWDSDDLQAARKCASFISGWVIDSTTGKRI